MKDETFLRVFQFHLRFMSDITVNPTPPKKI